MKTAKLNLKHIDYESSILKRKNWKSIVKSAVNSYKSKQEKNRPLNPDSIAVDIKDTNFFFLSTQRFQQLLSYRVNFV